MADNDSATTYTTADDSSSKRPAVGGSSPDSLYYWDTASQEKRRDDLDLKLPPGDIKNQGDEEPPKQYSLEAESIDKDSSFKGVAFYTTTSLD